MANILNRFYSFFIDPYKCNQKLKLLCYQLPIIVAVVVIAMMMKHLSLIAMFYSPSKIGAPFWAKGDVAQWFFHDLKLQFYMDLFIFPVRLIIISLFIFILKKIAKGKGNYINSCFIVSISVLIYIVYRIVLILLNLLSFVTKIPVLEFETPTAENLFSLFKAMILALPILLILMKLKMIILNILI